MDFFAAFEISAIAVLSPVLLAVGILHLLSAANLGASSLVCNALATGLGALRFTVDLPPPLSGLLTLLFVFFLILAVTVNARLCRRFLRTLSAPPVRVQPRPPRPRVYRPALAQTPVKVKAPAGAPNAKKRIQILSSRAWIIHNDWRDMRAFSVPPAIVEKNKQIPASDQQFRIVYGEDQDILEDTFTISQNLQILIPPEVIEKLRESPLLRFEIVDQPALT